MKKYFIVCWLLLLLWVPPSPYKARPDRLLSRTPLESHSSTGGFSFLFRRPGDLHFSLCAPPTPPYIQRGIKTRTFFSSSGPFLTLSVLYTFFYFIFPFLLHSNDIMFATKKSAPSSPILPRQPSTMYADAKI